MKSVAFAVVVAAVGAFVPGLVLAEDEAAAAPAGEQVRYLIMEPNAEVVFITTGGAEVRADWTEAATSNLRTGFIDQVSAAGYEISQFDNEQPAGDELQQLLYLYEVVSTSAELNMPHKGGFRSNRDITLGRTASLLAEAYDADRAIFIDHYSQIESGGVFLTQVAIGAATGYTPPSQNFRATIGTVIDLETGNILERSIAPLGDARDEGESANIVTRVLNNLPLE